MGGTKKTLIVICGQTATGKSNLAIQLASQIGAEIISADSMQVYRGLEFLTFPPKEEERKGILHYFISCIDPRQEYNVARFVKEAYPVVLDIWSRGKVVIVVGGTGLYIKCLLEGIFMGDTTDKKIRFQLWERWQAGEDLYHELKKVDPKAAGKIHPNDARRIIRALEVYYKTGQPISYWYGQRQYGVRSLADDVKAFILHAPRSVLVDRIRRRLEAIGQDELDMLRDILNKGLSKTAEKIIGISQLTAVLEGRMSLPQAKEEIVKVTYQYARRQMIWFRNQIVADVPSTYLLHVGQHVEREAIAKLHT